MKRLIPILCASLLFTCMSVASATSAGEKEIMDIEAALGQAMIHRDTTTLSKFVADDWTIQNDSGVMGSKAGFIHDVKSGRLIITSFKLHDLHVHMLGNVAYVQGFDDEKSSYDGENNSGTYNWLDVFERRDGKWVSVATQLTKVKSRP